MKKIFSATVGIILAFSVFLAIGATIQWYHQQPLITTLSDTYTFLAENPASNGYSSFKSTAVKTYIGKTNVADTASGGVLTGDWTVTGTMTVNGNGSGTTTVSNLVVTGSITGVGTNTIQIPRSIGITIDGGGSAIASGTKGYIAIPYSGTIQSCTMMADVAGSLEVRVWRTNSADGSFPPTAAGAIGTNSLSADNYAVDSTLTGWTKTLSAGDVIGFNVPATATTITRATVQLKVQP